MRWLLSGILVILLALVLTPQAHAIVVVPALVLIPIAKIVALIIGGFSFPALGIGAVWSKLFRKSLKRTLFVVLVLLVLLTIVLGVSLKLLNPDRPLF